MEEIPEVGKAPYFQGVGAVALATVPDWAWAQRKAGSVRFELCSG